MIIRCIECGTDYSDKADNCPKCACPTEAQEGAEVVSFQTSTTKSIEDGNKNISEKHNDNWKDDKPEVVSVEDKIKSSDPGKSLNKHSESVLKDLPKKINTTPNEQIIIAVGIFFSIPFIISIFTGIDLEKVVVNLIGYAISFAVSLGILYAVVRVIKKAWK